MNGMEKDSTASLLHRFRAGDDAARERLFERCLPLLRRIARGRLPQRGRELADTDDLVQVTLIRALNGLERFDPQHKGAFLAYLRTILMNAVREELRRTRGIPERSTLDEQLPDDAPSVIETVIGQETLAAYETALQQLTMAQRDAVILRLEFGMSYPEMALELELASADAARMLTTRGLATLARVMQ